MLFLSSLIFVVLMYVIPGELGLVILSPLLVNFSGLPYSVALAVLNGIVYVLILVTLFISKYAYDELQLEQEQTHRIVKEFLSVRGCHILNLFGVIIIVAGSLVFLVAGALPSAFIYLYAAIVVGFLDIFYKDRIVQFSGDNSLPVPMYETPTVDDEEPNAVFKWVYSRYDTSTADSHQASIRIGQSEYEERRSRERYSKTSLSDFALYVIEGETPSVVKLAWKLREISEELRYTAIQEAENIVSMVRSIPYASDQVTHGMSEYANFPVETLCEANLGSDCEDHAILAAALLDLLGHKVGLFYMDFADSAHMALAYVYPTDADGGGFCRRACHGQLYYYVETIPTTSENKIGDVAAAFLESLSKAEVIELDR